MLKIATAPRADSRYWTAQEISWDEFAEWVEEPAPVKQCGNYVLGELRGRERNSRTIKSRCALTLDADAASPDLPDIIGLLGIRSIIHTTYRSTPDAPRFRIIIPTDRDMTPAEYRTAAGVLMQRLGVEQFDRGSLQPERYMFKPSAQEPTHYRHWVFNGPAVAVESLLEDAPVDLTDEPTPPVTKQDPFTVPGTVGAFNRAYSLQAAIDEFALPYDEVRPGELWTKRDSHSVAGLRLIAPGIVYSHHANDPAYGKASSAFDLVRIHRYGELDADAAPGTPVNRLPSHNALLEEASGLQPVLAELIGQDFVEELEGEDWVSRLELNARTGSMRDTIGNWDLLRANWFPPLGLNEMSMQVEALDSLPWRPAGQDSPEWSETDLTNLSHAIEREFRLRPARAFLEDLVRAHADTVRINPVKDYLLGLRWDGTPRVEEALPGVTPTPYTRLVARKTFTGAVARIMEPGIKWDYTTIFYGPEGLGKSHWIDRVARGYSSPLARITDKDTLLAMQRSWIMVADEGFSLRKADTDAMKEFLTRRIDTFRAPYGRGVADYPRHVVFWGTTNDPVFLRRQEGNRRFLIVHSQDRVNFDILTDDYIDQLWAEAFHLYSRGEPLYLDHEQEDIVGEERDLYTEEDPLPGLISAYAALPVPENWDELSVEGRRQWLYGYREGFTPAGPGSVTALCTIQIWTEVLDRPVGTHTRVDLLNIGAALREAGWESGGSEWFPPYGNQVVYRRKED